MHEPAAAEEQGRGQGAARRARRERGAGRQEGQREGQVRDIAARQVYREQTAQRSPQRPAPASSARVTAEDRRGAHADERRHRVLEPGFGSDQGQVQRPRDRREQCRDPGPIPNQGDAAGGPHASPPEVDGDVRPDPDLPVVAERGAEEDDQQDESEPGQDGEIEADASANPRVRPHPDALKLPCAFTTIVPSPFFTPVHWN